MMTIVRTPNLAIAVSLLAALAAPAGAQTDTRPRYMVLTTYHVKPTAVADFGDFLKNKWIPAMKKGGTSPRIYSGTPLSGNSAVFAITYTLNSLARFDGQSALEKGAGEAGYARLLNQRAHMIESRTNVILTRQADMSVYLEPAPESPLLLVTHVRTGTGKQADFRALWVKDLVPAAKKAGRQVSAWRVAFGDETHFVMATPLASFAELDKGHTAAQLSMERAAYTTWNNAIGQTGLSTQREVWRLRRDLMGAE